LIVLQSDHPHLSFKDGLEASSQVSHVLLFLFLVVLSFVLRCIGAADIPLKFWDDLYTLQFSVNPFQQIFKYIKDQPFDGYVDWQSPLTNYIVACLLKLEKSDFFARMVSIVPGALAPGLVYLAASRLFSRRVGFIAGLLLAVNVFHIEHSQQVRCYSLYLTLSLVSLYGLYVWMEKRSRLWLVAHTVSTSLLLYTSYLSASTIGVELAWLGAICLRRKILDGLSLGDVFVEVWPIIASFAVCLLLYAPWLPNHLAMYFLLKGAKGNPDIAVLERLFLALNEMMSYWSGVMGYPKAGFPALVLAGIGLLGALALRRPGPLLFTLCWLGISIVMVVGFNREALHAKTRYLFNALPPFLMLVALGIGALGDLAQSCLSRSGFLRRTVPAVVAGAAFLWVTLFSIEAMPFFFRRDDDRLKDMAFDMAFHKRDIRQAGLWGSDSKWNPGFLGVALNWYLPGEFSDPGNEFSRQYRRVFIVTTPGSSASVASMTQAAPLWSYGKMNLNAVGLLNYAPLLVWSNSSEGYRHVESFDTLAVYSQAWHIENLHVDRGRIALADRTKKGRLEYAFSVPEGVELKSFVFSCTGAMLDTIAGPPDSSVRVEFLSETDQPMELDVASMAQFHAPGLQASSQPAIVERTFDLTNLVLGHRSFTVRVGLDPGSRLGHLEIRKIAFSGDVEGTPVEDPAILSARHIAINTGIIKWSPGIPPDGAKPFMFSLGTGMNSDSEDWNTAANFMDFQRMFPNAKPLATFQTRDGSGTIQVFDPYLAGPAAPPTEVIAPGHYEAGWTAASGISPGLISGSILPGPGWLNQNDDGCANYLFMPVFIPGQALPTSAGLEGGLIQHPGEQCLTCKDAAPCSVTYRFSSHNPFTRADIVYYPRWQADMRCKNKVRTSWSLDNVRWNELDIAHGWGSGRWEGWQIPRSLAIRPAAPVKEVFIRFDLSGDGAQLWSSPEHPMRIMLRTKPGLDTSSRIFPEPGRTPQNGDGFRYQLLLGRIPQVSGLLKRY
jgi:uncharacterized membrane protein